MVQLLFVWTSAILKSVFLHVLLFQKVLCEIEYNNINPDGSFSFRHSNDDIGSYYHSVAGDPNNSVRGRYGSRNPSNGRVEETVYTAGPRGFRVNGPQIHRKMDLSQVRRGRIGSADDPLADPYDDPTYSFSIKTQDYNRNEVADSNGRVRGLYSYFDDVGEKHVVRYAAGAGTGFQVLNSLPDSQSAAAYGAPLYKAVPEARGKISVQRGSNGLYKFIATGPDHRRSEMSGPDGIVRGAYSYLDDKGVQRTVEYEAGAGIGYRVIQNIVGRGSHLNTFIPNLHSNDLNSKEFLKTSSSGRFRPKSDVTHYTSSQEDDTEDNNYFENQIKKKVFDENSVSKPIRGGIRIKNTGKDDLSEKNTESENDSDKFSNINSKNMGSTSNNKGLSQKENDNRINALNFDDDLSSITPVITSNRRILEIGRERDWNTRNRDSTIIKNVGKWYIGLPPGQSVRAHVQNIDILPIGGRGLSPSEALRRDALSDKMYK